MSIREKALARAAKKMKLDKEDVKSKMIQELRNKLKAVEFNAVEFSEDEVIKIYRERAGDLLDAVGMTDDDMREVIKEVRKDE